MACDWKNAEKPEKREKKCKIISRIPPFFCKNGRNFGDGVCKVLDSNLLRQPIWANFTYQGEKARRGRSPRSTQFAPTSHGRLENGGERVGEPSEPRNTQNTRTPKAIGETGHILYCGIFIGSPSFRADWWARMPATVRFRAAVMSTSGLRFWRMAVTNSFIR